MYRQQTNQHCHLSYVIYLAMFGLLPLSAHLTSEYCLSCPICPIYLYIVLFSSNGQSEFPLVIHHCFDEYCVHYLLRQNYLHVGVLFSKYVKIYFLNRSVQRCFCYSISLHVLVICQFTSTCTVSSIYIVKFTCKCAPLVCFPCTMYNTFSACTA